MHRIYCIPHIPHTTGCLLRTTNTLSLLSEHGRPDIIDQIIELLRCAVAKERLRPTSGWLGVWIKKPTLHNSNGETISNHAWEWPIFRRWRCLWRKHVGRWCWLVLDHYRTDLISSHGPNGSFSLEFQCAHPDYSTGAAQRAPWGFPVLQPHKFLVISNLQKHVCNKSGSQSI